MSTPNAFKRLNQNAEVSDNVDVRVEEGRLCDEALIEACKSLSVFAQNGRLEHDYLARKSYYSGYFAGDQSCRHGALEFHLRAVPRVAVYGLNIASQEKMAN